MEAISNTSAVHKFTIPVDAINLKKARVNPGFHFTHNCPLLKSFKAAFPDQGKNAERSTPNGIYDDYGRCIALLKKPFTFRQYKLMLDDERDLVIEVTFINSNN